MKAHRNLIMICGALAALVVPTIAKPSSLEIVAGDPQLPGVVSAVWRSPPGDMVHDLTPPFSLARGQAVLRADISELQPEGHLYGGGVGYFRVGPETGDFEVAVMVPFEAESFTPMIYTPAGSLTFSLGSGEPRIYSGCNMFEFSTFLPPPPRSCFECFAFTTGTHYTGSFSLPTDIRAELLAGRGEFRLLSGSGTLLSGTMDVVLSAVPEPSTLGLLFCGVVTLAGRVRKRV